MDLYNNYIIDNTLTYTENINLHGFSVMLGNSVRMENWKCLAGNASNVPDYSTTYWYLAQGNADGRTVSDNGHKYHGLSFFNRATYDYDSKYLCSSTFRADASSKYQEKWGYFPSVVLGWIVSNES
ncbi:MAG: hypothetical protein ACRCR9_03380 [Chitinophagaceae bacterium]